MVSKPRKGVSQEGEFVERFCVQFKGREGGQLIRYRDWQRQLTTELFATDPVTGRRVYRTAHRSTTRLHLPT